jgi:hypothetical protein
MRNDHDLDELLYLKGRGFGTWLDKPFRNLPETPEVLIPGPRSAVAAVCRWSLERNGNSTDQYTSPGTIRRLNLTMINDLLEFLVHSGPN